MIGDKISISVERTMKEKGIEQATDVSNIPAHMLEPEYAMNLLEMCADIASRVIENIAKTDAQRKNYKQFIVNNIKI